MVHIVLLIRPIFVARDSAAAVARLRRCHRKADHSGFAPLIIIPIRDNECNIGDFVKVNSAEKEFIWFGNWLAVDFINTSPGSELHPADKLPDAQAFKRWLIEGGVAGADSILLDSENRDRCWSFALAYRALLRRGVAALAAGQALPDALVPKTNMLLAEPDNADRIVEEDGAFRLATAPKFQSPRTLVIPVARSFAKLLIEADQARLRECRNPMCGLYFYDSSKSGTRAWCSLGLCGNRSRVAAFRRKQTQSAVYESGAQSRPD